MLLQGFGTVVGNPLIILAMLGGVFIGIIFGSLPGLTTVACLSMFLPVTYVMSHEMGLSMLTAIYIGGMSGGLVSAILLNIPGTPSSIATCFDGTPMAKKGQAGRALGIGVFASIVGNFIGVFAMIFISA
ncbi:MAG: tripartite tricarboxylate transporter permease, partial [Sphaerochaetaceae bacterium]|nr:tripartite tricarboxylate transporter permease [Sphaerochaetaceae bacterium]